MTPNLPINFPTHDFFEFLEMYTHDARYAPTLNRIGMLVYRVAYRLTDEQAIKNCQSKINSGVHTTVCDIVKDLDMIPEMDDKLKIVSLLIHHALSIKNGLLTIHPNSMCSEFLDLNDQYPITMIFPTGGNGTCLKAEHNGKHVVSIMRRYNHHNHKNKPITWIFDRSTEHIRDRYMENVYIFDHDHKDGTDSQISKFVNLSKSAPGPVYLIGTKSTMTLFEPFTKYVHAVTPSDNICVSPFETFSLKSDDFVVIAHENLQNEKRKNSIWYPEHIIMARVKRNNKGNSPDLVFRNLVDKLTKSTCKISGRSDCVTPQTLCLDIRDRTLPVVAGMRIRPHAINPSIYSGDRICDMLIKELKMYYAGEVDDVRAHLKDDTYVRLDPVNHTMSIHKHVPHIYISRLPYLLVSCAIDAFIVSDSLFSRTVQGKQRNKSQALSKQKACAHNNEIGKKEEEEELKYDFSCDKLYITIDRLLGQIDEKNDRQHFVETMSSYYDTFRVRSPCKFLTDNRLECTSLGSRGTIMGNFA